MTVSSDLLSLTRARLAGVLPLLCVHLGLEFLAERDQSAGVAFRHGSGGFVLDRVPLLAAATEGVGVGSWQVRERDLGRAGLMCCPLDGAPGSHGERLRRRGPRDEGCDLGWGHRTRGVRRNPRHPQFDHRQRAPIRPRSRVSSGGERSCASGAGGSGRSKVQGQSSKVVSRSFAARLKCPKFQVRRQDRAANWAIGRSPRRRGCSAGRSLQRVQPNL